MSSKMKKNMPKKLHVVFSKHVKDVVLISESKAEIEAFFERKSRHEEFFYQCVKDPDHIELFIRDFSDKYPEVAGSTVMLDYEYIGMIESIPMLISDLLGELRGIVTNINYLKLTKEEEYSIMLMAKTLMDRLNYDMDDETIDWDDIFEVEGLMNRYLDDTGV